MRFAKEHLFGIIVGVVIAEMYRRKAGAQGG